MEKQSFREERVLDLKNGLKTGRRVNFTFVLSRDIYSGHPPHHGMGEILSKLKNREEFEGGLEKKEGKRGERRKKEKSDKTHVKIHL